MIKAAFVHSPDIDSVSYGAMHPFVVARSGKTLSLCRSKGLVEPGALVVTPGPADMETMLAFHDENYLRLLQSAEHGEPTSQWLSAGLGTEDCPVFHGLWDYVCRYTGGSLRGAQLIETNKAERVFHPAGGLHHATKNRAAGFCYVNDVVLAAGIFRNSGRRIAIIDLDAHHGNGTQEAFYEDPEVLTISLHESGETLFPWGGFPQETGLGRGQGFNVNVPLPAGAHDGLFEKAIDEIVLPLVIRFAPDVIIVEIGGDVLATDPLTHLALTNNAIASAIEKLDVFSVPWLVVGGGGYNVDATVRAWALSWSILTHQPIENPYAGLIGGAMTGLADLEEGDLRDPVRSVSPEKRVALDADFDATLRQLRDLHGL